MIDDRKTKRILAGELRQSLREQPETWRFTYKDATYSLTHETGVRVSFWGGETKVSEPREIGFGWRDWFRLRLAYRAWRRVHGREQERRQSAANAILVLSTLRGEQPLRRAA